MLRELSNRIHQVITGICLLTPHTEIIDHEETKVTFYPLTDAEIRMYLNSDEPFDKAGAYGIQDDFGAVFVNHIEGCYYNIVGLPLELLYSMLKKLKD